MGKSLPQFHFFNPADQLPHVIDLALERPGISVGDLAWLLNLSPSWALELAREAEREAQVSIDFETLEHT